MGSSIELSNGDMNVFLKESAYMFRTIIGDFVLIFIKKFGGEGMFFSVYVLCVWGEGRVGWGGEVIFTIFFSLES